MIDTQAVVLSDGRTLKVTRYLEDVIDGLAPVTRHAVAEPAWTLDGEPVSGVQAAELVTAELKRTRR